MLVIVQTDKYAQPQPQPQPEHRPSPPFKLDNSLFSGRVCAKFSNLCQPFGPELTSLVIHYGRQRRDSFLNNISWGWHWGWHCTEKEDEGSSIFPPVLSHNWSLSLSLSCVTCLHCEANTAAIQPCLTMSSLHCWTDWLTDWSGSTSILILIWSISGRRRQLENSRDVDGLRGREWKTNGCDKKYSSSSSEKNHPNKSFLISSYHQEQRFSQLHLCLIYLVLVSLIHCAGQS